MEARIRQTGARSPPVKPRGAAIISDIHGHLEGLQRVLDDIEHRDCDQIVCLGDLVDNGEHNEELVALIRTR